MYGKNGNHGALFVVVHFFFSIKFQTMRRYGELIEPNNLGRATFLIEQTKVCISFHSFKSQSQSQL